MERLDPADRGCHAEELEVDGCDVLNLSVFGHRQNDSVDVSERQCRLVKQLVAGRWVWDRSAAAGGGVSSWDSCGGFLSSIRVDKFVAVVC